jgi:hypothetical protein
MSKRSIERRIISLERARARPRPPAKGRRRIWTDEEIEDRYGGIIQKLAERTDVLNEQQLLDGMKLCERIRQYRARGYQDRF